jgi:phage FluMu protein Com
MGVIVKEVRCTKCNKKLAEADYRRLAIKCPRCGLMNVLKAIEPPNSAPSARKERLNDNPVP